MFQRAVVGQQVADLAGHGLDAVEGEQRLALLAEQRDTFGILLAAELTVVLGPVLRPRGEAARRVGQRQVTVGEDLGLQLLQAQLRSLTSTPRSSLPETSTGGIQRRMPQEYSSARA